jgi:hypothetical protein
MRAPMTSLAALGFLMASCTAPGGVARLAPGDRWYGSETFCIALHSDETIERQDGGEDYILFLYRRGGEEIVIYQGNYPSPGGAIIRTGMNFPALLSVHGSRELARRLLVGKRRSACG